MKNQKRLPAKGETCIGSRISPLAMLHIACDPATDKDSAGMISFSILPGSDYPKETTEEYWKRFGRMMKGKCIDGKTSSSYYHDDSGIPISLQWNTIPAQPNMLLGSAMDLLEPHMRVFEFDSGHMQEWVAARTRAEALECYANYTSERVEDWEDECRELTMEEMEGGNVLSDESMDEEDIPEDQEHLYENGHKIVGSFWEVAQKCKHPEVIASSEY